MPNNEQQSQPRQLVAAEEEAQISRSMMIWINNCPDIPDEIQLVDYEHLPADKPGMALSVTQGTYILKRYIVGGYVAEYQFSVLYRVNPGTSSNARLSADELLNTIGDWASRNRPELGESIRVRRLDISARAALLAAYENGDEDHQILMRMEYEVI